MNVKFESRFEKDLKLVKDRNLLTRLKQIILTCKQADSLGEINNLKKKILTKIKPKIFKGKLLSGDMYVQIIK